MNEFFEGKDGKLNLIQLFIEQFYKGDRLIVLDLCDGEFVFDIIYKVLKTYKIDRCDLGFMPISI